MVPKASEMVDCKQWRSRKYPYHYCKIMVRVEGWLCEKNQRTVQSV